MKAVLVGLGEKFVWNYFPSQGFFPSPYTLCLHGAGLMCGAALCRCANPLRDLSQLSCVAPARPRSVTSAILFTRLLSYRSTKECGAVTTLGCDDRFPNTQEEGITTRHEISLICRKETDILQIVEFPL